MANEEGKVYVCIWSRLGKQFTIALQEVPRISVTGRDFEEAQEMMWDRLCEEFGDEEAVLEFANPLPKSEFQKKYGTPEIVRVAGNGGRGRLLNEEEVLISQACKVCRRTLSERTNTIAEWDYLPDSDGWVTFKNTGDIFSETFLSLFSDAEKSCLSFIPVKGPKGARKQFFELLPGKPIANYVGVPRFPGLLHKKCNACGSFERVYLHNNELFQFIARTDLPQELPPLFVIGDSTSFGL